MLKRITCKFLIVLAFCAIAVVAHAQTGKGGTNEVLNAIMPALEQAEKAGATVIVVAPGQTDKDGAALVSDSSFSNQLMRARFRFGLVWKGHGEAAANMAETLAKSSPDGKSNWLMKAVIAGIICLVVGRLFTKPIANWARDIFVPRIPAVPRTRADKIGQVLFSAVMYLVMALISAAIGTLLVVLYAGDHEPTRITGVTIVWTYAAYRFVRAIYANFLMPNVSAYRPIVMADTDAKSLYRSLMIMSAISATTIGLCIWMDRLGLSQNTHKLALMMSSLIAAILLAGVAVFFRKPIANAILGGRDPADCPFWKRTLAKTWHIAAVLYVMLAWGTSTTRLLLDQSGAVGLVAAPLLAIVLGVAFYGLLLVAIDKFFDRDLPDQPVGTEAEGPLAPLYGGEAIIDGADAAAEPSQPLAEIEQIEVYTGRSIFKGLAEHAAAMLITIVGLVYIAEVWNVDLSDSQNWITDSLEIVIVLFMAYLAYRAVEIWVDAKREQEGDIESDEPGGDPGGHGASRLVTLLPIFRNFLLITIVVIAGMITLSEIGVDIAPLFAGAGVVGLAIGFGAQTLIRDIFSGAFFLIDDAFRKGEYIDIGTVKGTVEKISIRSFQLRHHRGALNTVPFGEIKQLTNYSRDWVMMKLPIRLTYDTDLEKVRKLVKNLGQELLEDPDLGPKFLQPLKSQGAAQMEDSAMIVRLKFMTRPGDQFAIRTKVFTLIRELFEKEGIKFAHREVTVRVNDPNADPAAQAAAAGAAIAGQAEKPAKS